MIYNPNNEKYQSASDGFSSEVRQVCEPALVYQADHERKLGSQRFSLHPTLRDTPDIDRLGRAILEMAMRQTA